jgi:hypothetical protein
LFNPEAREARARLEAHRRHDASGGDLDALTREVMAEMNAADDDDHLDEWADDAPRMTGPQLARIRRAATAGDRQAAAS